MFETQSTDQLAALFDQFSVPMFAADRASGDSYFKIVCTNTAHAKATGLLPTSLRNATLWDILPDVESRQVNDRYTQCADFGRDLRYFETLTMPEGLQYWDTSIQHVPLREGGDRVIGTAFQITRDRCAEGNRITYDNIKFFSSLADMQLQNLVSMFESAKEQGLFRDDSAERVTRLCGICRAVQSSVDDIKAAVRNVRPDRAIETHKPLTTNDDHTRDIMEELGGKTLRALFDSAQETT